MDSDVVQAFNKALVSICDTKPPISKQKIFDITKAAMSAVRYFKHVVFIIEKFLVKCRPEYKISGLYVIDSIVRQARKQYQHKDVFAPRFAINLQNTFINILDCDASEKLKAIRVINLWLANKIFEESVIEPLLQHSRAMGLEVDTEKVEVIVKGDRANMRIYGAEASLLSSSQVGVGVSPVKPLKSATPVKSRVAPRTPPLELRPKTPPNSSSENLASVSLSERDVLGLLESHSTPLAKLIADDKDALSRVLRMVNDRITERLEIERRRRGNIKNLLSREFDYSDEEEDEDHRFRNENSISNISKDSLLSTARSLFLDNSLSGELQALRQEIMTRPQHQHHHQQQPQHYHHQQQHLQQHSDAKTPPPIESPSPSSASMPHLQHQHPPLMGYPTGVPPIPGISQQQQQPPLMQLNFGVPPPSLLTAGGENASFIAMPSAGTSKFDSFADVSGKSSGRKRGRSRSIERDHDFRDARREDSSADDSRRSTRDGARSDRRERDRRKQRRSRSPSADKSASRHRERDDRDRRRVEEERERERERERRRNGLPTRPKEAHVLIASRTLWLGRIPSQCSEADICAALKDVDVPERVNIVAPRACAYVTMKERRAAFKIIDKNDKDPIQMQRRNIKLSWATISGLKDNEKLMDYWDVNRGIALIPHSKLPEQLDSLLDGAYLDVDTLPEHLKGIYDAYGLKSRVLDSNTQGDPRIGVAAVTTTASLVAPTNGSVLATPAVQPNVFSSMFASNLPNSGNLFPFQSMGMPSTFMANQAATAAVVAAAAAANGGVVAPPSADAMAQQSQQQQQQQQQQQRQPFNAAAFNVAAAGMMAFGFAPSGAQTLFPAGQRASNMPAPNTFMGARFPPPPVDATADNGAQQLQNAFPPSFQQMPPNQFNNNAATQRGGNFSNARGAWRGGRFPPRGTDGFRGRGGGFGRGGGGFRGGRGGVGSFPFHHHQQQQGEECKNPNIENVSDNNGYAGMNRFGRGARGGGGVGGAGFGGGRGAPPRFRPPFFHAGGNEPPAAFVSGAGQPPQRFYAPASSQSSTQDAAYNSSASNTVDDSSNFVDVDALFAENKMSDDAQNQPSSASSFKAGQQTAETPVDDAEPSTIPDLSAISIPRLSATTMSNLREIIDSTRVGGGIPPVETAKLGGMDEYDDEDDENYFKALGSRAAINDEPHQSDSTTTSAAAANSSIVHDEQKSEVSSTTLYDDTEKPVVTTSAGGDARDFSSHGDISKREETKNAASSPKHVHSSSVEVTVTQPTIAVNASVTETFVPMFSMRAVPTDAVEVHVDEQQANISNDDGRA